MLKNTLFYLIIVTGLILLSNCGKNNHETELNKTKEKMVLIYISANNDLKSEAISTIKQLQKGIKNINGSLLVYVKIDQNVSHLLKLKFSSGEKLIADTLKTYENENSTDPEFFEKVILDSRFFVPAYSYGLVLWSHATSWIPAKKTIKTRAFGIDNGFEMDLIDLKNSLPDDFEFILFDACYMGSIEVLYELRNKAKYLISSPAEVLIYGFPYQECASDLFNEEEGLKNISRKFFNYYSGKSDMHASATITLIDALKLRNIAIETKALLKEEKLKNLSSNNVQKLNFQKGSEFISSYDFFDFFNQNYEKNELKSLSEALNNAIIYKANTYNFLNIKIKSFSGLSIYFPVETNTDYLKIYENLEWNKDTDWMSYFKLN